jgi:hypothetical protein
MSTPKRFDLLSYSEQRANCAPENWYSIEDFVEAGFDRRQAQFWLAADVSPAEAMAYENLDLSPSQAWEWRMVPHVVQSFMEAGFDRDTAWQWADVEIFGHEAMFWRHAGYAPEEAAAVRAATRPVGQSVLWALTGLHPEEAFDHATHGSNPADFLSPPILEGPAERKDRWPMPF